MTLEQERDAKNTVLMRILLQEGINSEYLFLDKKYLHKPTMLVVIKIPNGSILVTWAGLGYTLRQEIDGIIDENRGLDHALAGEILCYIQQHNH